MNFKSHFLLLITFLTLAGSCGVKGPPKAPAGTEISPWSKEYLDKYSNKQ